MSTPDRIDDVRLIAPPVRHTDHRGYVSEIYRASNWHELFVQQNHARSMKNVLRGMHYQAGQGKLVRCTEGEIFDVVVDMREGSRTYRRWYGVTLTPDGRSLYVPPGCAHGFYVLSETADVVYLLTREYQPQSEFGLAWNDPAIGIEWPSRTPILSDKDAAWPRLRGAA